MVTLVFIAKNVMYQAVCDMRANLTIDYVDGPGVNPDEQHAQQ